MILHIFCFLCSIGIIKWCHPKMVTSGADLSLKQCAWCHNTLVKFSNAMVRNWSYELETESYVNLQKVVWSLCHLSLYHCHLKCFWLVFQQISIPANLLPIEPTWTACCWLLSEWHKQHFGLLSFIKP